MSEISAVEEACSNEEVFKPSESSITFADNLNVAIESTVESTIEARNEAYKAAENVLLESAVDVQVKLTEAISEESPGREEMEEALRNLDEVTNINSLSDVISAEAKSSGMIKNSISKISEIFQKCTEAVRNRFNKIAEKSMSKEALKDYENATESRDSAAEELAKAIKDKDLSAQESAKAKLDAEQANLDKILEKNPDFDQELRSKIGRKRSNIQKSLMKYSKLLSILGLGLGLWFVLWYVSKDLTGCYKFLGTVSSKLSCPSEDNKYSCGCGSAQQGIRDGPGLKKICGGDPPGVGDYKNYPFCCSAFSPDRPTCSGNPGRDGSVYYAWDVVTPAGILSGIPADINNLVDETTNISSKLLTNAVKFIVIAIIGIILLFILMKLVGYMFNSKSK